MVASLKLARSSGVKGLLRRRAALGAFVAEWLGEFPEVGALRGPFIPEWS
jgi:hypothetical protein